MRTDNPAIERVYTAGMNLAMQLRLVKKHEEAHQIEMWTLSLCEDLEEEDGNG
jgi:hypothetical protein